MPSILIINPNSSVSITQNLTSIIKPTPGFKYTFFTGPSHTSDITIENDPDSSISLCNYAPNPTDLAAPAMIDNSSTSILSAAACLPYLKPLLDTHDAFLVACFSDHPLVNMLREILPVHKPVTGIFQASVLSTLSVGATKFAIVTTAKIWESLLDTAVLSLLGSHVHYAGTFSTGLGVLEIHDLPQDIVTQKLVQKAKEAVDAGAKSIILGCAGLSGLDEAIRNEVGKEIVIVDSVIAGVEALTGVVRNQSAFYGDMS